MRRRRCDVKLRYSATFSVRPRKSTLPAMQFAGYTLLLTHTGCTTLNIKFIHTSVSQTRFRGTYGSIKHH